MNKVQNAEADGLECNYIVPLPLAGKPQRLGHWVSAMQSVLK